ncbi:hypothetical protein [Aquimarina sp. 2304DJ70-9]|uniref:hypothetical protein n=1 Tax=Aquimarina penaris TaxID=3231044 RepID=UPI003461D89D
MKTLKKRLEGINHKRAFWIMVVWILISNFIFIYDHATLYYANAIEESYNFWGNYLNYIILTIIVGIIGGVYTVGRMELWLQKLPFWKALLYILAKFIIIGGSIALIGAASFVTVDTGLSFFSAEVWSESLALLQTWPYIKTFFVWLFIVMITLVVVKFKYIDS